MYFFFWYFGCDGTFETEFDCKGKPRAEIDKWPVLAHIGTYRPPTRIQIVKNNFGSETVETIGCKVDLKTFWSPGHQGQVEIVHLVNDQNKLP